MSCNNTLAYHINQDEKKESTLCDSFNENFTKIPNHLIDLIPVIGVGAFGIASLFYKKTIGWHKSRDRISLTQIEKGTNLSRKTIIKHTKKLVDIGLFKKEIINNDTYFEVLPLPKKGKIEPISGGNNPLVGGGSNHFCGGKIPLAPVENFHTQKKLLQKKKTATDVDTVQVSQPEKLLFAAASSTSSLSSESKVPQPHVPAKQSPPQRQHTTAEPILSDVPKQPQKALVYKCLESVDTTSDEKQYLTKRYSEPVVAKSVAWATHPQTTLKKPIAAALKWYCDQPEDARPKTKQDKASDEQKNKSLAKNWERQVESPYYSMLALDKQIFLEAKGGNNFIEIPYATENFSHILHKQLTTLGFKEIQHRL